MRGSRPSLVRSEDSSDLMWSAPRRWIARKVREKSTLEARR